MATIQVDRPVSGDAVRIPSVLVVLVASDAAGWLRESLQSLAQQTHPRVGVVAVDNASTDGTFELLTQALGQQRVIRMAENEGFAAAVRAAADLPAAQAADYLLILHDDAALAQDAVARMVDAAEGIRGVERVGIVGPKVVDWSDPRLLREVGRSTDPFGHPYSPLQDGELDQGQYDRVLEVLFVSSCAMLISREAWNRAGAFDERFAGHHDDLDLCWRARLAGFRVLMTPLAVARHLGATDRGQRIVERRRSARYYGERAALASMLKDYGVLTLLWLFPLYVAFGAVRLVALAASRRFEDAFDLVRAWGWNLLHVPSTLRRRVRAQSVRSVRDRSIRRFMAGAFRLPRWFERAEEFLDEGFEELETDEETEPIRPLRRRAAAIALGHPVLIASVIGLALGAVAIRHFVGPHPLSGGALPAFPGAAGDFFEELVSGVRTTVLGGPQPASPALAVLGSLTWASFGNPALAQKVLLVMLPPLAAILAYRSFARQTGRPGTAVVAASAYALSALALWAFSQGRVAILVALAAFPVIWDRLDGAFRRRGPDRAFRFGVGLGVAVAFAVSFEPGSVLPIAIAAVVHLVVGRRRGRGLVLGLLGAVTAALLAFPVVAEIVSAPSATLSSTIGTADAWELLRLAPGDGPGSWAAAAFLPLAALICFAAVEADERGRAWRAMLVLLAGIGLGWASAVGWLPTWATNQPAYLAAAAFAAAGVVAYGAPGLLSGLGRRAFGLRQIAAAMLTVLLVIGIGGQALRTAVAEWDVRPNGLPPAWPVVDGSAPGEFRILWIGTPLGEGFPAPGGDPTGVLGAGDASVRYAVTDRHGASGLDVGRGTTGAGYDALAAALDAILSGEAGHGGALLAPFGVRFVVAAAGDLPSATRERLDAQVDLDRVPAGGLTIYRNASALPTAFVVEDEAAVPPETDALDEIAMRDNLAVERIGPPEASPLEVPAAGVVVAADQYDAAWRVSDGGAPVRVRPAFGWAIASAGPLGPGVVTFDHTDQWVRTLEIVALAALWLAALWITRKPGSS